MKNADEIDRILADLRVFSLDPNRRRELVGMLAAQDIDPRMLKTVYSEAKRASMSEEQARGLFVTILRDVPRLRTIYEDVCAVEDRKRSTRIGGDAADLRLATPQNPYGWEDQKLRDEFDHSRVGEWNAARQCYNWTAAEMSERGITDPRPQGCTRSDVLGQFDPQRVKDGADILPAATWQEPRKVVPPGNAETPDRDVYR